MSIRKGTTTIRDVAREAGVSHQTVSRVINDSSDVHPTTRAKVQTAIIKLGFRPNAVARSMAQGCTNTLACISPNLTDYTFASIIEGAEHEARKFGYFLLSSSAESPEDFGTLVDELVGHHRVDGLIIINPYADARYEHAPVNFPLVLVGAHSRDKKNCSVCLDEEKVAYEATRYLISLGHFRIAMVTGPMEEDCCVDRSSGYTRAMKQADLPVESSLIVEGNWSANSGRSAMLLLKERGRLPSAVFSQNDRMALGVLSAARDMGLKIPNQLAVIGVDDMPLASYFDPPLTTMHQDMPRIGLEAVRMLVKSIENSQYNCTQMKIPARLVIRRSTYLEGGER